MDPCSAGSAIIASTAAPCPAANDSTTLVLAGKVYRYIKPTNINDTYFEVKAKCAELDSYPVVFNTWKEHLDVENYFQYHQIIKAYWLGLRQVGNNGVW
jgi:hypothetical protein